MPEYIRKRNGKLESWNVKKITEAIKKAMEAENIKDPILAHKLALKVENKFKNIKEVDLETVQDEVEITLMENGFYKVAKRYILYREERRKLRSQKETFMDISKVVDGYIKKEDWRVAENSNITHSFQGLMLHLSGSVQARYVLNRYPEEIRTAHEYGYIHIHDLSFGLAGYCAGWSLRDLLLEGFNLEGRCSAGPPKHLDSAFGQMVNFLGTLQNEWAGAQAFNNVDTYLAPFIKKDKLSYKEVKQIVQKFLFNINTTSRWGGQCVTEDTFCLTPEGLKTYRELKPGDTIYSLNLKTGKIEEDKILKLNVYEYKGELCNFNNHIFDFQTTPNHRIIFTLPDKRKYFLNTAENILEKISKEKIIIPLAEEIEKEDPAIPEEEIKLFAWILASESKYLTENSISICLYDESSFTRVLYLADKSGIYAVKSQTTQIHPVWGPTKYILVLTGETLAKQHEHIVFKKIPEKIIKYGNKYTFKTFIKEYLLALSCLYGFNGKKILEKNEKFINDFQLLCTLSGIATQKIQEKNGLYSLEFYENSSVTITNVEKVKYQGIVWCPTTTNGTFIAYKDGIPFITGNSPFTNLTFDFTPPEHLKKEAVIIGGKLQDSTYGEYQKEMDMINKAFLENMLEGDYHGRIFSFPIPTYNVTKDFPWNSENGKLLLELTAKYGVPYFQNFISSDLKPEDVRSMCIHPEEELIVRFQGKIKRITMKELVKNITFDEEGWAECKDEIEAISLNFKEGKAEWVRILRFLKREDDTLVRIITNENKEIRVSSRHLVPVLTPQGLVNKFAKDIKKGDYLLNLKKFPELNTTYQKLENFTFDEDFAYFMGYFTANGNFLKNGEKVKGIQISFNHSKKEEQDIIREKIKKLFNTVPKEKKDPRFETYYMYIYNSKLAEMLYNAGFRKYGRLPDILFNSPAKVIKAFLAGFFKGDGYEKRKEIHINDRNLARDLILLYTLTGIPVTYREREKSQRIYIQHQKNKNLNKPILSKRIPKFLVKNQTTIPGGLNTRETIGEDTLKEYNAEICINNEDFYIVKVKDIRIEKLETPITFYDIELEKNHLFCHSLGTITHNCCRLQMDLRELKRRTGGLFGAGDLTGSIGVVTINLPKLAYLSKNEEEFLDLVKEYAVLAKNALEFKRKWITTNLENNLFPYTKRYLKCGYKNHFSTIGIVGGHEACLNLLGKGIDTSEGLELMKKVLNMLRELTRKFQEETGNLYNLEATPAEGTSYRLARIDKRMYPDIITSGTDEPYYTNSTNLPVKTDMDLFEALEHQNQLQPLYTGGTVFHVYLGEAVANPETLKHFITKIFTRTKLPYISITPTFSICKEHGYLKGEHWTCPVCGQPAEVYSRVVGYYRPVSQWNKGKQEEYKERKTFIL